MLVAPKLEDKRGPTQVEAVNLVLEALSACTGQSQEFDFLLSTISQCRDYFRSSFPLSTPDQVLENLKPILSNLDAMEYCLKEQNDFNQLVRAATDLERTTNDFLKSSENREEQALDFVSETEGLPMMLRSLLEPAFRFLDGSVEIDVVFEAADHLETMVSQMQHQASLVQSDVKLESIQQALQLMQETSEILRELAETGNPQLLDYAQDLSRQVAAHLQEADLE